MTPLNRCRRVCAALAIVLLTGSVLPAQGKKNDDEDIVYPVAVLPF